MRSVARLSRTYLYYDTGTLSSLLLQGKGETTIWAGNLIRITIEVFSYVAVRNGRGIVVTPGATIEKSLQSNYRFNGRNPHLFDWSI